MLNSALSYYFIQHLFKREKQISALNFLVIWHPNTVAILNFLIPIYFYIQQYWFSWILCLMGFLIFEIPTANLLSLQIFCFCTKNAFLAFSFPLWTVIGILQNKYTSWQIREINGNCCVLKDIKEKKEEEEEDDENYLFKWNTIECKINIKQMVNLIFWYLKCKFKD